MDVKTVGPMYGIVAVLTIALVPAAPHAMSGMETPHGGHTHGSSALSKSMGEPINSPDAEIEITYSADGKTAIFVSGREGSIPSPGVPYNFDIWMSHSVDGVWQPPIHLGPGIDPTVGPNINTSAWELEPSLSEDGNVIYFTRYEPGNLSTGDLYVGDVGQNRLEEIDVVPAGSGGRNFGCGSSREQAATCLVYNGVGAVIAVSFSRIFYRNALNNGLLAIVCPAAAEAIQPGEQVTIDTERHTIRCAAGEFTFPPLSASVMGIVRAGGLVEYVKQKLATT